MGNHFSPMQVTALGSLRVVGVFRAVRFPRAAVALPSFRKFLEDGLIQPRIARDFDEWSRDRSILRFVAQQVLLEIQQRGIGPPDGFDEGTVSDIERSLPPAQERAPILGKSEVEMENL